MRDYSTQAARHRRPKKKRPSAATGITLSIALLGAVATGLIWLNQSTSVTGSAEPKRPEPRIGEPQLSASETSINSKKSIIVHDKIPEASENFYTFYELLITGEVPIDVEVGQSRDEAVAETLKSTIIQVASFKTAEAADDTRVALLFLDLKARVIPPSESNGGW
ncbi:MAG: SPOR domain-containing protein, partial [Litorivicinaceae bacterium]